MTVLPSRLPLALQALDQILDTPRRPGVALGNWRWHVRQRISAVREALMSEGDQDSADGWLAARGGSAFVERNDLLARLGALGPRVLDTPDVEATRQELKALVVEIRRHAQRATDPRAEPV